MNKLEETFQHIMDTYGHDVLVIHNEEEKKCSCYDLVTGSPDRDCPYCFGLGFISEVKRYVTRHVDARIPQSNTFMRDKTPFGDIAIDTRVYYFYKTKKLKEGDYIVEVEWDGNVPTYQNEGVYQVSHVNPLNYIDGKTTYYQVFVKNQPINKEIKGIRVTKDMDGNYLYQIAEGEKYYPPNAGEAQKPDIDIGIKTDNEGGG